MASNDTADPSPLINELIRMLATGAMTQAEARTRLGIIDPALICAHPQCGHSYASHRTPGTECAAELTATAPGTYCACPRFEGDTAMELIDARKLTRQQLQGRLVRLLDLSGVGDADVLKRALELRLAAACEQCGTFDWSGDGEERRPEFSGSFYSKRCKRCQTARVEQRRVQLFALRRECVDAFPTTTVPQDYDGIIRFALRRGTISPQRAAELFNLIDDADLAERVAEHGVAGLPEGGG